MSVTQEIPRKQAVALTELNGPIARRLTTKLSARSRVAMHKFLFAGLLLVCACSDTTSIMDDYSGPASGMDARYISLCDLGMALHQTFDLHCMRTRPSPFFRSDVFWPERRPCRQEVRRADGQLTDAVAYDYSQPQMYPAQAGDLQIGRRPDGSIDRVVRPSDNVSLQLVYDDKGVLRSIEAFDGVDLLRTYELQYDGRRRIAEGISNEGTFSPVYVYVYDASGRLEREGPPGPAGAPPVRLPDAVIEDCTRLWVPELTCAEGSLVPPIEGPVYYAPLAFVSYFYDEQNRLENLIFALVPGRPIVRYRFIYRNGGLSSIVGGDPKDFSAPAQTVDYLFDDCASLPRS